MAEIKKIFLDTDIGGDCDDAAALAVLLELEKEGKCFLEGISCSTAKNGSSSTAKAICNYFGFSKPVGRMCGPINYRGTHDYAVLTKEKWGFPDSEETGVKLARKIFSQATGKIDIIAIGPLTTIKDILSSEPDEISNKSGIELLNEKGGILYIQGGSFLENFEISGKNPDKINYEYNIREDLSSARFVLENYGNEIILCPYEAGEKVYTEIPKTNSPLRFSSDCCAAILNLDPDEFKNSSWDPQTCLFAVEDCSEFFELSEYGTICLEKGYTQLIPDPLGKHRYLRLRPGYQGVEKRINELIAKLENSVISR